MNQYVSQRFITLPPSSLNVLRGSSWPLRFHQSLRLTVVHHPPPPRLQQAVHLPSVSSLRLIIQYGSPWFKHSAVSATTTFTHSAFDSSSTELRGILPSQSSSSYAPQSIAAEQNSFPLSHPKKRRRISPEWLFITNFVRRSEGKVTRPAAKSRSVSGWHWWGLQYLLCVLLKRIESSIHTQGRKQINSNIQIT